MNSFKVSIIIPTYGRINEFKKLINSIKKSSIDINSYEIIIVSSDSYDSEKIKWIETQKNELNIRSFIEADRKTVRNRSLYYYENIGIKNALNDWILVCNDDMWFESDWYVKFINYISESKVYLISSHIGSINLGLRIPSIGSINKDNNSQEMWLYDMSIIHKTIYEKINYLDENIKWYGKGADLALAVAFLTDEIPVLCNDVKINHDISQENRVENINDRMDYSLDFNYIINKWNKWIEEKNKNFSYKWI